MELVQATSPRDELKALLDDIVDKLKQATTMVNTQKAAQTERHRVGQVSHEKGFDVEKASEIQDIWTRLHRLRQSLGMGKETPEERDVDQKARARFLKEKQKVLEKIRLQRQEEAKQQQDLATKIGEWVAVQQDVLTRLQVIIEVKQTPGDVAAEATHPSVFLLMWKNFEAHLKVLKAMERQIPDSGIKKNLQGNFQQIYDKKLKEFQELAAKEKEFKQQKELLRENACQNHRNILNLYDQIIKLLETTDNIESKEIIDLQEQVRKIEQQQEQLGENLSIVELAAIQLAFAHETMDRTVQYDKALEAAETRIALQQQGEPLQQADQGEPLQQDEPKPKKKRRRPSIYGRRKKPRK